MTKEATKQATKKATKIDQMAHPVPVRIQRQSDSFLSVIERAATGEADVAKMQELYQMLKGMREDEAKSQFASDWVRMKPSLPRVIRTKKNTQTNSMYAPQEDINEEIDPILSEYGFGTGGDLVSQTKEDVTVRVEVWHRDGFVKSLVITMPIDDKGMAGKTNKTVLHGISSAISYAKRVGTCLLLNISTGDDRDGNTPKGPKQKDAFASRVAQEAHQGEVIELTIEEQLGTQAQKIVDSMEKQPLKSKRGAILMKNTAVMKQLDEYGMADWIETLHALVAGGADDAE